MCPAEGKIGLQPSAPGHMRHTLLHDSLHVRSMYDSYCSGGRYGRRAARAIHAFFKQLIGQALPLGRSRSHSTAEYGCFALYMLHTVQYRHGAMLQFSCTWKGTTMTAALRQLAHKRARAGGPLSRMFPSGKQHVFCSITDKTFLFKPSASHSNH